MIYKFALKKTQFLLNNVFKFLIDFYLIKLTVNSKLITHLGKMLDINYKRATICFL